jgi:phosphoketolase
MAKAKDARTNGQKTASNGHNGNGVIPPHFGSRLINTIPNGRKGKHNLIVSMILDDLAKLDVERAILVPLDSLEGEKMENVRSALNRATRQKEMFVSTATDEKYFYVWRTDPNKVSATAPDNSGSHNHQR